MGKLNNDVEYVFKRRLHFTDSTYLILLTVWLYLTYQRIINPESGTLDYAISVLWLFVFLKLVFYVFIQWKYTTIKINSNGFAYDCSINYFSWHSRWQDLSGVYSSNTWHRCVKR